MDIKCFVEIASGIGLIRENKIKREIAKLFWRTDPSERAEVLSCVYGQSSSSIDQSEQHRFSVSNYRLS